MLHDRMAGRVPLEIGTRGTVGSLLKREIEYFRRLELERVESCRYSERNSEEKGAGGPSSWPSFKSLVASCRKKKRRNSGIRPAGGAGICSMVDVADSQGLSEIPGFSYRNLRADSKRYDV